MKEEQIFQDAIEQPADQRMEFLLDACGGDVALRERVEVLLKAHANPGSFLGSPAAELAATTDTCSITEQPGTVIGPYKLLQQIGEGGMGVVFMAEQTEPLQRTVALKIIKPGMDTRQVIARFEAERQALAMMDHPNIARVVDAGTTDTGRPYFVMDLVKGVPVTEYCDRQQLPVGERLELMSAVCQAVQHAHQKGIIHRDIKPSNVLVAEYDGKPVPKVIDFGVAKATAQRLTERTMFTQYGQVVGTFEYMSPEQARFNQLDVDTRSDIYSLGVLLYEVLAGSTPLEKERLRSAAYEEVLRIICEEEPPWPSTRLSTSQSLPSIAANRNLEPKKLSGLVRGELDWIVMKCLEKDRSRRYETASSLAMDLQRYFNDEPVEARPASRTYRLKKFIRRNKASVLAGSAIVSALVVGLILATIGFVQARRQAEIAHTEAVRADHESNNALTQAAKSQQVAQFLKDMLAAAGPGVARGRDATLLREILDKTADRVEKDLKDQPEVQADLWFILGTTYRDIGDYPRAIKSYQHAIDGYRLALGAENAKLAVALGRLGDLQGYIGEFSDGSANTQLGLDIARKLGDPETLATCLLCRARTLRPWSVLIGEGVPLLREAVALRRQLDNDPVALADCLQALGGSLYHTDEAESLHRDALALYRQHLEPDHPKIAGGLFLLGQTLRKRDKFDEAETVFRQTLDLYRKLYDKDHPRRPHVLRFLAQTLMSRGKSDEAITIARQECESIPSARENWVCLEALYVYTDQPLAAAERLSRDVEIDPNNFQSRFDLIVALLKAGRLEEYRRQCHDFLDRAADSNAYGIENFAAKASLLLPIEGDDFQRACTMADIDASATEPNWMLPAMNLVRALAEYRRDRFESANQWAGRAVQVNDDHPEFARTDFKAAAWFIQAASSARLNQNEAARAALAKGDEIVTGDKIGGDHLFHWAHWTIADLLRREAVELLEPKPTSGQAPNGTDSTPTSKPTTDH